MACRVGFEPTSLVLETRAQPLYQRHIIKQDNFGFHLKENFVFVAEIILKLGADEETRTPTVRFLRPHPLPLGYIG